MDYYFDSDKYYEDMIEAYNEDMKNNDEPTIDPESDFMYYFYSDWFETAQEDFLNWLKENKITKGWYEFQAGWLKFYDFSDMEQGDKDLMDFISIANDYATHGHNHNDDFGFSMDRWIPLTKKNLRQILTDRLAEDSGRLDEERTAVEIVDDVYHIVDAYHGFKDVQLTYDWRSTKLEDMVKIPKLLRAGKKGISEVIAELTDSKGQIQI